MTETTVRIESVQVVGRHRKDLGDLAGLAKSIANRLINPITITPDLRLIAGERRLEAARLLGWQVIDARIVDTFDDATAMLLLERDENTERKPMAPSELVALGKALEELERPKAAERKAATLKRGTESPLIPGGINGAMTTEIVAEALGTSNTSYDRMRFVVDTANNPDLPEDERRNAQEAMAEMDATGKIAPAYEKVRSKTDRRRRSSLRTPPQRPTIGNASEQRQAVNAAIVSLSGITYGLEQIVEIHPKITDEEAAQWVDGLSTSRRVIERLIKRLKEHNNAQL